MSIQIDNTELKLRKELEELRAEYREFVYAVSHDLTAPFRHIEGFANIIISNHNDQFDSETKRHFKHIIDGSEKGKAILEGLLEYSRLITSDFSSNFVDCNNIIKEVKQELDSLVTSSGAEISCEVMPNIMGDSDQLFKSFYHLIHNALHYRDLNRPLKISIKTTEMENSWQFCIKDNGIGFRQQLADKIFVPLGRCVSDNDYPGIGMGLTIASSVVRRHGGRIWVMTLEGEGSSFYFTLDKVCDS